MGRTVRKEFAISEEGGKYMGRRLGIISFTEHGSRLNGQISSLLPQQGYLCESYAMKKYAGKYGLLPLEVPAKEWAGEMFARMDALLFIGAAGIAVRSIAPYLKGKDQDPAVTVMDERGMFVISLLSGHLGGANELAGMLANLTGAIPVITTATDIHGRFAVDLLAKKQNLWISDLKAAKHISADVLDENPVGLLCEFPVTGEIPEELTVCRDGQPFDGNSGMVISLNEEKRPFLHTLHLIPRIVTLGIGCRKGADAGKVEETVLRVLARFHLSLHSVEQIVSIDLKKEEAGILEFCGKYGIPYQVYTAQELQAVPGTFRSSEFVQKTVGVDCVCERSAVLGSGYGTLIMQKQAADGVTVAAALREWSVDFE